MTILGWMSTGELCFISGFRVKLCQNLIEIYELTLSNWVVRALNQNPVLFDYIQVSIWPMTQTTPIL